MSFTKQQTGELIFHTADSFTAAGGVGHGFATRLGGVSTGPYASLNLGWHPILRPDLPENVEENYRRLSTAIGGDPTRIVTTHQVHGDIIRIPTEADIFPVLMDPMPYDADGLITNDPTLCLTIYYADCIPVFLYDPVKRCIGAIHSGWRGTQQAIVPKGIRMLQETYGSDPADILVAIGPGIGPCCFETHDDVPTAMEEAFGPVIRSFCRPAETPGKFHVDLKGILSWQIRNAGIAPGHLEVLPLCTGCHPELYWSHRKMGSQRGTQAAMIQLRPVE